MKKTLALFLLAVLLPNLLLIGCEKPKDSKDNGSNEEEEIETYMGYEFRILQSGPEEKLFIAYDNNSSPQTEALKKRVSDIEQKYDIQVTLKNDVDIGEGLYTRVMAGTLRSDLIFTGTGNQMWYTAKSGALTPMTDFPDIIDLSDSDKYGEPGILEAAMHNGIPYCVQPTYWPGFQSIEYFFIAYNQDMMKACGLTDLHEYYEAKNWTWDTYQSFMKSAYDAVDSETKLLTGHVAFLLNTIFQSDGVSFYTESDGELTFSLADPRILKACDFYSELFLQFGDKLAVGTTRWDTSRFVNQSTLTAMAVAKDVTVGDIAYKSDFAYGIMPFPCGPDATYGTWQQAVTRIYGFGIPVDAEEAVLSATFISELLEPFPEFGSTQEELKEYYKSNVFLNELDADIFFAVAHNVRYDYDDGSPSFIASFIQPIGEGLQKGTKGAASLLEYNENVGKRVFEERIKPNLEGYLADKLK